MISFISTHKYLIMETVYFASTKDLPAIQELLDLYKKEEKTTRAGIDNITIDDYKQLILEPSNQWGDRKTIVCYHDDVIQYVGHGFFKKLVPSWIFKGLLMRPGNNYWNCATNGVGAGLTFLVNYAEANGYFEYEYHLRAGKTYANRYARMRYQIPALARYDHYYVGFVPANTKSKFLGIDQLMGGPKPYDCYIRKAIIKEEEFAKDRIL